MKISENIFLKLYGKFGRRLGLYPNGIKKELTLAKIRLRINYLDLGVDAYYKSSNSYKECSSRLYDLLQSDLKPEIFLDIGANYGFIGSVACAKIPNLRVIAVEPSKELIPYINENFKLNGIKDFEVLHSLCGDKNITETSFALNPGASLDNRVVAPDKGWANEEVSMTTIDTILKDVGQDVPVFIKIDTQGFEEKVFSGAIDFLSTNKNWVVKAEFSPRFLEVQNTNPVDFLLQLCTKYEVAELPDSIPYLTHVLDDLFAFKICPENVEGFIAHLRSLNKDKLGWCDLILRPKS